MGEIFLLYRCTRLGLHGFGIECPLSFWENALQWTTLCSQLKVLCTFVLETGLKFTTKSLELQIETRSPAESHLLNFYLDHSWGEVRVEQEVQFLRLQKPLD